MVSEERKALERIKTVLITEGYNDQDGLKDISLLEGCVNASEILRIIFNAPFIIEALLNKDELGKDATDRYLCGTISEKDRIKVKEFFADGKRN